MFKVCTRDMPDTTRKASLTPRAGHSKQGKDKQHHWCEEKGKTCILKEKANTGVSAQQYIYSSEDFPNLHFPKTPPFLPVYKDLVAHSAVLGKTWQLPVPTSHQHESIPWAQLPPGFPGPR